MTERPTIEEVRLARRPHIGVPDVHEQAALDKVLAWAEHYVTDPGRITIDGNPAARDNERALLQRNGIDTADVLVAGYERLGNMVRYRLRSTGALVERELATDASMGCVPVNGAAR